MEQHWSGYLNALGNKNQIPQTSMEPVEIYPTSSSKIGVSGFLDLKPQNPKVQAKYDAMSGSWEGVQASEAATKYGVFKADSLPVESQKQTPSTK
jgi:hypothetical protein